MKTKSINLYSELVNAGKPARVIAKITPSEDKAFKVFFRAPPLVKDKHITKLCNMFVGSVVEIVSVTY